MAGPDRAETGGPLPGALYSGPLIEVAATSALIRFPGAGGILVDTDELIRVPADGRDVVDLAMLEDPALALQWLLRSVLSLRASVVAKYGSAVVIAGDALTGKSTIAAALAVSGWAVLGDAVAPIRLSAGTAPGGFEVMATSNVLHLWLKGISSLGLDLDDATMLRPGIRKFAVQHPGRDDSSVPLSTIVILRPTRQLPLAPQRLSGGEAVGALSRLIWHAAAAKDVLGPIELFRWTTEIARNVRIVAVDVVDDFDPSGVAAAIDDVHGEIIRVAQ
jgi:hypothetical protein